MVNQEIINSLLADDPMTPEGQLGLTEGFKAHIKKDGKKRYIEVPDDYFNDIDAKVSVITTGEQKNKAVILQSLSEILKTVIGSYNPNSGKFGVLEDKTLNKVFGEILEIAGSGVSPVSLGKIGSGQPTAQPTAAPEIADPSSLPAPMSPPLAQ